MKKNKSNRLSKPVMPQETTRKLAETFKVLGDPTRTRIIYALSMEELCVCDIAGLLGAEQSVVSHQLRVLRNMNLVKYRRDGRVVYYSLDDEHIKNLFDECLRHVNML
ncbi:MAG: helix-turn-helix transcriptional regulator [Planctomycetes bacterium]|nr:helix-turn-helix transcriptional regulator [Planctomycetota bacterium]